VRSPLRASWIGRIRRLLGDLRRPETRSDAVLRVRRRAGSGLRRLIGQSGSTDPATGRPAGANGSPTATKRPDSWYVGEWSRLATVILGPDVDGTAQPRNAAQAPDAVKHAARQRAQATLAEAIARGEPLERAVCRSVAALAELVEYHAAWALAEGVGSLPGGSSASAMGHAVLLHRRRQFERAWTVVRDLDDEALSRHIPVEAVDAALAAGTAAARQRALAIGARAEWMDAPTLVDLAGRFLAFEERERAADLVAELRRRSPVDLDERRRYAWTLIERWLDRRPISVPTGSVPVAVIDYRSPDHVLTSGNLGDYIQTLSMVGNLVRLSGVRFTGEDGLGELATELQARVKPTLREPDARGAIHLLPVDRDFSGAEDIPMGTWMIAFGWHMHPLFDLRYDFPYHPNIRPLFVSFHVNRLDMLTDAAQDYLRRHGPIGCRDWNTVFLLLGAGIDAFFSGCLTSTIDVLFPDRDAVFAGKGTVGVIDLPARAAGRDASDVRVYTHQDDAHRYMSLTEGLRTAHTALAAYQRDLKRAVTRRLHAYLPLTALGVPVEFRTTIPGDVRFAGLTGLRPGDARLTEMRDGIRSVIARAFEPILAGADETEVYRAWREVTRDRVAEARARFEAPVVDVPTTIDLTAAVATTRAGSRRFGPHDGVDGNAVTDLVLSFDQNLTTPAAVLLESIVANASGPIRLWVLARGLSDAYQEWLAAAFPAVPMTFLPCDEIRYGPKGSPPSGPGPNHRLHDGSAPAPDHARGRRSRRVPRRRHADARRHLRPGPHGSRRLPRRRARFERERGQRMATLRTRTRRTNRDGPAATNVAPTRLRTRRAECRRARDGSRADATRRLHIDVSRPRRAVWPARPGHDAGLRRARQGGPRPSLERHARSRGRAGSEPHPLGELQQAMGSGAELRAGPLAFVCGDAP
jgi:hypothetical protein